MSTKKPTDNKKPWLDRKGRRLPLAELRVVSQSWDETIWEEYQQAHDTPLRVELVDDFDAVLRDYEKDQADRAEVEEREREATEEKFQQLDTAMADLPQEDRALLQAVYWDGLSLRDLAHAFHMSRKTVIKRHNRAVCHLREKMGATPPLYRGIPFLTEIQDLENPECSNSDEIDSDHLDHHP